mmetsp:Transcript_16160/g.50565  ORF Transcript_16160/g.50565 Transcript_16160/m.50565 type:complete len:263 (-) Transcript_16160:183-971(-)
MPQGDYVELAQKRRGKRFDHDEKVRKREARAHKRIGKTAQSLTGLRAKIFANKRYAEKAALKKAIRLNEQKAVKKGSDEAPVAPEGAVPHYLLDRSQAERGKVLSNSIKEKRKEKAGKWDVPLPRVRPMAEDELFRVTKSGKRQKKAWKRLVTKATFVGEDFRRAPPKMERFIRPTGLRVKKANVVHPELKSTFCLPILGVKKNPQGALQTQLGVVTKGTIIEVDVSELGLVTAGGRVVFSKYAQVTSNPEMCGSVEAVLLV